jgi:hypothetical protein
MEPRANANEDAAIEPFRAVVAVGNTAVWGVVIVAIRTIRGNSDFDADLSIRFGRGRRKHETGNSRYCKNFKSIHPFSSLWPGFEVTSPSILNSSEAN